MSDDNGKIDKKSSWWSKQSTANKAVVIFVGVCCLGPILIVGMGAMLTPEAPAPIPEAPAPAPNIETYKQNLVNLEKNPEAYVGETVTIVSKRGLIFRHEASPLLRLIEGTEVVIGDNETRPIITLWFAETPENIDRFEYIKATGIFKRNVHPDTPFVWGLQTM